MIHGMDDDLITLPEFARLADLSARRIRQLAADDPAFPERRRVGRYWLVSRAAAEQYIVNRTAKPGRPPHRDPS